VRCTVYFLLLFFFWRLLVPYSGPSHCRPLGALPGLQVVT